MVTPEPGEAFRFGTEADDGISIECWVCGRTLAADEPRRLIRLAPNVRHEPPFEGYACLGCYQGRQQTYVPGAAEGRLTSRVLLIPAPEFAS